MVYGGTGNDSISASGLVYSGDDADSITGTGTPGTGGLYGGGGNDFIRGFGLLHVGGAGRDTLSGGAGSDRVRGNGGADRFVFASVSDFAPDANRDLILDFSSVQGDKIDLFGIDAVAGGADDAFSFTGTAAFGNVAGQLRYEGARRPDRLRRSRRQWCGRLQLRPAGERDTERRGFHPVVRCRCG